MKTKLLLAALLASTVAGHAFAADTLKLAIGQRGNWDTSVAELGQRAGIFKKHDLDLDLLYTQGGGETMQAVISGSVDIGVAAGTLGVLGAFSKGAPVRIIGAQATGAADFWYVPADSKLQSLKDADADTTIAFSTNGSSTNSMVLGFIDQYGLKSKPVATGSPSATFTPVMTGQVDVGWSSPPFGFDALDEGKIRIVARGNDIDAIRNQSIRTLIGNQQFVEEHPDELQRFMAAYRETIDWMYSGDEALKTYADFVGVDEKTAKRIRDEFFPKSLIDPDKMSGMDQIMADAVQYKTLSDKLTDEQLAQLIQIPPRQ
ncbi:ABC transporter substrate-binding protein [Jiella endophytica]|uniref:ABC transporter substrate-binding protein n=1 Tax=Jiella endophytica TaxID=2558362 RepID=A0A4Y8RJC8_9HYPH|nr:ABC transporter substrate-binding protein [Jiella endophytica]TFF23104.1 ABC transporter substrate-binding protein [Jiella endophytica]